MTSKEALKLAILEYEKDLEFDKNNQWVKNVLKGLKDGQQDLEVLEILKNYLYYDNENHRKYDCNCNCFFLHGKELIKQPRKPEECEKPKMATHCVKEEQLSLFECMMNNEEKEE